MRDWFRLKVPCSIFKCEIIYLTHSYVVIKLDLWCFGFNILYKNKKAYKFNKKNLTIEIVMVIYVIKSFNKLL